MEVHRILNSRHTHADSIVFTLSRVNPAHTVLLPFHEQRFACRKSMLRQAIPKQGNVGRVRVELWGTCMNLWRRDIRSSRQKLVGGLEHIFSIYIGNSNPIWLIFFRGVDTTNQETKEQALWVPGPSSQSQSKFITTDPADAQTWL